MNPDPKQEIKKQAPKPDPDFSQPRPFTILSESDAYISERIKEQPKVESDIEVVAREDLLGMHRLSLPDFFEELSYDCTRGISCKYHGWVREEIVYGFDKKMDRWEQTKRGKYIFRWLSKAKRALDISLNVKGWYLVNKTFFKDAPDGVFSANGGVENGDSILGFMPVSKALALRIKPSKDSLDRVHSEEKKHEGHPNFYKADLSPEKQSGDDFAPTDALQDGRDF